jgi:hypothetical protein
MSLTLTAGGASLDLQEGGGSGRYPNRAARPGKVKDLVAFLHALWALND